MRHDRWYLLSVIGLLLILGISIITCSQQSSTPSSSQPSSATEVVISWEEAKWHIGERVTVCGPVVGTTYAFSSKGQPTFINIGRNYPDPNRFTVVIWGTNRHKFSPPPDIYYRGKTICVYGLITEYKGIAQIEATSPSQIKIK